MLRHTLAPEALATPGEPVSQASGLRTFSQFDRLGTDDLLSQARTPPAAARAPGCSIGGTLTEQLVAAGLSAGGTRSLGPKSRHLEPLPGSGAVTSSPHDLQMQVVNSGAVQGPGGSCMSPGANTPASAAQPAGQASLRSPPPCDSGGVPTFEMTQRMPLLHSAAQNSGSGGARQYVIKETQSSQSSPLCSRAPAGMTQCSQARQAARLAGGADAPYELSPVNASRKLAERPAAIAQTVAALVSAAGAQQPVAPAAAEATPAPRSRQQAPCVSAYGTASGLERAGSTPGPPKIDATATGTHSSASLPRQECSSSDRGRQQAATPGAMQGGTPARAGARVSPAGMVAAGSHAPAQAISQEVRAAADDGDPGRSGGLVRRRVDFCPPAQAGPAPRCVPGSHARKARRVMPTPTAGPAFEAAQRRRQLLQAPLTCMQPQVMPGAQHAGVPLRCCAHLMLLPSTSRLTFLHVHVRQCAILDSPPGLKTRAPHTRFDVTDHRWCNVQVRRERGPRQTRRSWQRIGRPANAQPPWPSRWLRFSTARAGRGSRASSRSAPVSGRSVISGRARCSQGRVHQPARHPSHTRYECRRRIVRLQAPARRGSKPRQAQQAGQAQQGKLASSVSSGNDSAALYSPLPRIRGDGGHCWSATRKPATS